MSEENTHYSAIFFTELENELGSIQEKLASQKTVLDNKVLELLQNRFTYFSLLSFAAGFDVLGSYAEVFANFVNVFIQKEDLSANRSFVLEYFEFFVKLKDVVKQGAPLNYMQRKIEMSDFVLKNQTL